MKFRYYEYCPIGRTLPIILFVDKRSLYATVIETDDIAINWELGSELPVTPSWVKNKCKPVVYLEEIKRLDKKRFLMGI